MKYQQLENLESGWKWKYLVKKHREGELITRYIEASAAQEAVDVLLSLENEPVLVNGWIDKHMNPELVNRMKQTIRQDESAILMRNTSIRAKNRSIWNLLSGNVWLVLRSVAVKRFLKRLFS